MRFFYGQEKRPIDGKNRIVLPARFRMQMGTSEGRLEVFLVRGAEGCIYLYPRETWEKLREQFTSPGYAPAGDRLVMRMFYGSASYETCDKQGRLPLPEHLQNLAGLDGEVICVGVNDHIELWSPARWRKYCEKGSAEYEGQLDEFCGRLRGDERADLRGD